MPESKCPVSRIIERLDDTIEKGRLKFPTSKRLAEEILDRMRDIARGNASSDPITVIQSLARELIQKGAETTSIDLGKMVDAVLTDDRECLLDHVQSRNCPTGDCVNLVPAPCQMACPAGIDVPAYVTLIGQGKDAEAVEVIRRDNPFPWVCGLVCTRPCETACVRAVIDTPVSIRFLKAFAAESAMAQGRYKNPRKRRAKNRKVAIIGAGPGGMSAAYYLALKGYAVRVIEALSVSGGMIAVGIPRYRLPREVIDREVAMLEELGVEFAYNTRFGTDVTLAQLKSQGFEAFLLAIGAHESFKLGIPGESDFPQIIDAIEFLRKTAQGDRRGPGQKVIILGGGNVAIDAARTCLRLGCREVTVAYRRSPGEMPADKQEVEQAGKEGVNFSFLTIPTAVTGSKGQIQALKCIRAKLVEIKGSRRRFPVPLKGTEYLIEADAVIPAIGQQVDHRCLAELTDLKWTRRKTIDIRSSNMVTHQEGVFAVGDAVTGPATVIEAIGGGKRAADSIDRYLSGIPERKTPPVPLRRARLDWLEVPASTKMELERPQMKLLSVNQRRTTFKQVALGYSENQVRAEARRCLRCDSCRRCGECVKVCRDQMKIDALQLGYVDVDHPQKTEFRTTDKRCIACGACASICTSNAMQMIDRADERILSLCGTVLTRQKLVFCQECGGAVGTVKYLDYIDKQVQKITRVKSGPVVCDACARKKNAQLPTIPL